MKIGFIFECSAQGPDQQVFEHLAVRVDPAVEIINCVTNSNKESLIQKCGTQTKILLSQGCERIIIVWDLMPRWKSKKKPYCQTDVMKVRQSLQKAQADVEQVRLLCITAELEALLIADERALKTLLSRPTHAAKCSRKKNPHRLPDPKGDLENIYKEHGYPYSPRTDSLKIVRAMPDLSRLRPIPSFARFEKLMCNKDFHCQRHL